MNHELPSLRKHASWRLALAAAVAFACFAPSPLHAADRYWIDPFGGDFNNSINPLDHSNWSNTSGGSGLFGSPPGTGDNAIFDLDSSYTVSFSTDITNRTLAVRNGTVTFDLNGNTYTLTEDGSSILGGTAILVGIAWEPTRLTVTDGLLTVEDNGNELIVGQHNTSSLTVSTGGQLGNAAVLARPNVIIGDESLSGSRSDGTLLVNNNGRVSANFVALGNDFGSNGTATITGPNAVMTDRSLIVGNSGAGDVTVSSGGTLSSSGGATLGENLGSDGDVTVTGAGSSWLTSGTTTLGNGGDGTLAISSGGIVSSVGAVTFGFTQTGFGTATVSGAGSRWELSAAHTIGASGLGVMTVSSGGQVVSSANAVVGLNAAGEGRVTVTGAGSQWTLGGLLNVGFNGTGNLLVSAGGEVSAPTTTIGYLSSADGTVTVTGTGSKLTTSGALIVADNGGGTLNVASGAEVEVGGALTVDNPAGSPIGTLHLDGGSIFVADAFTNRGVFNFSDGSLQVAGDFQPSAAAAALTMNGVDNGDLPTLELIGSGTTTNVTSLTVGQDRRGQLLLRQGRVVDLGAGAVDIGAAVGGEGTISVQSGAQLLTTRHLTVGGVGAVAGGAGTLEISGGTVETDALRIFRDGTVHLRSGTLAVNSLPVLDGQFNWTGGTLRFDAATSLTSTNVPRLLGLDATLDAGQALTSAAGVAVTLQTPVIVEGGTLSASSLINHSRIEVRSGSLGAVTNNGLILGDGTISGAVTNNAAGKIRVDAGKTLFFTAAFAPNAGELNLQGGTLDFSGAITNSAGAFIAGRGALYARGLTNNGQMAFSGGMTDLHGDVTNSAGAVITTGGGSVTTFFDDVVNQGQIRTNAGSRTVIFGAVSGAGSFPGTGVVEQLGDTRPGNSPAIVSYGGELEFGDTSRLFLELGGTTAGAEYDRVTVADRVSLDGTLDVNLLGGFTPSANQSFVLMTYGSHTGAFNLLDLPSLSGGLTWSLDYGSSALVLSVTPRTLLPGDIDLDGDVDRTDVSLFTQNFGRTTGSVWTTGDFNADGATNLLDLSLQQANFGLTAPSPSPPSAAVPEPATWGMVLLAVLIFWRGRIGVAARRIRHVGRASGA